MLIEKITALCRANNHSGVNHGAHSLACEILKLIESDVPDPVETSNRLGPKITAHDIKRIADALDMPDDALIDDMVLKIDGLMLYAD